MLNAGAADRARSPPARPTAPILRTSLRFHSDMHSPTLISSNGPYSHTIRLDDKKCKKIHQSAAIPEPRGQACSKCRGSLEMPALRAEGEIRDERFWPERGKNQGLGHTAAVGSYRRADSKLRGRAVPKVNGADHGDRADGMKSW